MTPIKRANPFIRFLLRFRRVQVEMTTDNVLLKISENPETRAAASDDAFMLSFVVYKALFGKRYLITWRTAPPPCHPDKACPFVDAGLEPRTKADMPTISVAGSCLVSVCDCAEKDGAPLSMYGAPPYHDEGE